MYLKNLKLPDFVQYISQWSKPNFFKRITPEVFLNFIFIFFCTHKKNIFLLLVTHYSSVRKTFYTHTHKPKITFLKFYNFKNEVALLLYFFLNKKIKLTHTFTQTQIFFSKKKINFSTFTPFCFFFSKQKLFKYVINLGFKKLKLEKIEFFIFKIFEKNKKRELTNSKKKNFIFVVLYITK